MTFAAMQCIECTGMITLFTVQKRQVFRGEVPDLASVTGLLVDACPEGVAMVQDGIVAATREEPGTSDEGLTGMHCWFPYQSACLLLCMHSLLTECMHSDRRLTHMCNIPFLEQSR